LDAKIATRTQTANSTITVMLLNSAVVFDPSTASLVSDTTCGSLSIVSGCTRLAIAMRFSTSLKSYGGVGGGGGDVDGGGSDVGDDVGGGSGVDIGVDIGVDVDAGGCDVERLFEGVCADVGGGGGADVCGGCGADVGGGVETVALCVTFWVTFRVMFCVMFRMVRFAVVILVALKVVLKVRQTRSRASLGSSGASSVHSRMGSKAFPAA
jgi:hypothetical protein